MMLLVLYAYNEDVQEHLRDSNTVNRRQYCILNVEAEVSIYPKKLLLTIYVTSLAYRNILR